MGCRNTRHGARAVIFECTHAQMFFEISFWKKPSHELRCWRKNSAKTKNAVLNNSHHGSLRWISMTDGSVILINLFLEPRWIPSIGMWCLINILRISTPSERSNNILMHSIPKYQEGTDFGLLKDFSEWLQRTVSKMAHRHRKTPQYQKENTDKNRMCIKKIRKVYKKVQKVYKKNMKSV